MNTAFAIEQTDDYTKYLSDKYLDDLVNEYYKENNVDNDNSNSQKEQQANHKDTYSHKHKHDDNTRKSYNKQDYNSISFVAKNFNFNYNAEKPGKSPTNEKKFECKTGQFRGFYVSSLVFCNLEISV